MASITPQHMKEVLSKPHQQRRDFEVRMVVDWLRNTVRHFRSVNDDVMRRLVEEGTTETFGKHEMIILEGDIGNVMYVLLTGRVSIYRKRDVESEERRELAVQVDGRQQLFADRTAFGEEVAVLEDPGIIFGEIALIEDAPRSASVIANDVTQLFAISRDLYARTVHEVVKKEFRAKHDFINQTPCFQSWNPRYKKQLAMALQVVHYDFEAAVARQGDPVRGIYYILKGQVRLSVVPHQHISQFASALSGDDLERILQMGAPAEDKSTSPGTSPVRKLTPTQQRMERVRKSSNQNRPLEVCLLDGSNEESLRTSCFGDTEVILGYETYLCSVKATGRTVLLELDMRSFDRLVLRRNARAIELMREESQRRLERWLDRTHNRVPFFRYSLERLMDPRGKSNSPARGHSEKGKPATATSPSSNTLQLPPNGPLVDQYGPGTVFSYIRQKDTERKARKAHSSRLDRSVEHQRHEDEERAAEEVERRRQIMDLFTAADAAHPPSNNPVPSAATVEESEDMIIDLESRLRAFLSSHREQSVPSASPLEVDVAARDRYRLKVTPMARVRKVSDPLPARPQLQ